MRSAYLVDAVRTPFGRLGGALAGVRTDDLAALPVAALLARHPQLDPGAFDEVILGCANQAGEDNRNIARMAVLLSGLPETVPGVTVNRLCASGLEAIGQAARAITCGDAELIMAGGVESMTRSPYVMSKSDAAFGRNQQLEDTTLGWRFVNPRIVAQFGVDSMTRTAQNLADEYGIDRASQDAYALRSQQRVANAQREGWLAEELVPVVTVLDKQEKIVSVDEHPRAGSSIEKMAALLPLLGDGTSITAGNASGLNDGACALILASEDATRTFSLTPLARVVGMASAGVMPRVMGFGSVPAIRKLLARTKLTLSDFEHIEINEAFAAQVLACTRALGLRDDAEHVNPNGGAIALGHPLGASGARIAMTAAFALRRRHQTRALVSLCVGVGQGLAMVLEAV
jgi:3-oxoadipyl-CoA thiolase